ncbi:hypothetical protein CRV24_008441 [Beauveria bassiana]|nr:hypothetical protein CRV24_008441 [Beauveria bassiana]KAH8716522.1 hypothetical protein HC256_005285 [Beauveria bassiana]
MAGLAMAVSHEPRMVSSLIDVPNDRCPKGRCMDDSMVATEILEEILYGSGRCTPVQVADVTTDA